MNVYPNKLSKKLIYFGFSASKSEICVGLSSGYRICVCDPFSQDSVVPIGGIGIAEKIGQDEKWMALVCGGRKPAFVSACQIVVYKGEKWVKELSFASEVLTIQSVGKYFCVVMEDQITIFGPKCEKMLEIKTAFNADGLCSMAHNKKNSTLLLAHTTKKKGELEIHEITLKKGHEKRSKKIPCSESGVVCCDFTENGAKIATASKTGTLFRVFSTDFDGKFGEKRHEFRRGLHTASIYSMSFSKNEKYLAVTSSQGTVHVFSMVDDSPRSFFSNLISYEKAIAEFKDESLINTPHICSFIDKHTVGILSASGTFFRLKFDFLQKERPIRPKEVKKKRFV